jgi:hypothetical protein
MEAKQNIENGETAGADRELAKHGSSAASVGGDEALQTAQATQASQDPEPSTRRTWKETLVREVRTHPFGYTVLALFVAAGPMVAPFLFPQASPGVAVVGGLAFGLYAALCAVPQKFL